MREIKFRAWDEKRIAFIDIESNKLIINLQGQLMMKCKSKMTNGFYSWDDYYYSEKNNCILEQYTGLKDKHGKEIYEGDILNGGNYQGSLALGIVVFENGAFICKPIGRFMESFEEGYRFNRLQIIGNIHENPELLK